MSDLHMGCQLCLADVPLTYRAKLLRLNSVCPACINLIDPILDAVFILWDAESANICGEVTGLANALAELHPDQQFLCVSHETSVWRLDDLGVIRAQFFPEKFHQTN